MWECVAMTKILAKIFLFAWKFDLWWNFLALFLWLPDKCWNVNNVTWCLWQRMILNWYTAWILDSKPYLRLPEYVDCYDWHILSRDPGITANGVFIRDIGPVELDAFRLDQLLQPPDLEYVSTFAVLDCCEDSQSKSNVWLPFWQPVIPILWLLITGMPTAACETLVSLISWV